MKRNNLKIIGLTGGIGTGKSTVSSHLKTLGYKVIDADEIAREVLKKGSIGLHKVADTFGEGYILGDGRLNRKKMRELVFNNKDALNTLESITHPLIRARIQGLIKSYNEDHETDTVILDCPLLFEMKLDVLTDENWLITCSNETQIKRIVKRDDTTREEATKIINQQMSLAEKKLKSDIIIENDSTIVALEKEIDKIVKERL